MSTRHAALEHGTGTLADLVADARAIPAAAFGLSKSATRRASRVADRVIDLTHPARDVIIAIPETTVTFLKDAEQAFADYFG